MSLSFDDRYRNYSRVSFEESLLYRKLGHLERKLEQKKEALANYYEAKSCQSLLMSEKAMGKTVSEEDREAFLSASLTFSRLYPENQDSLEGSVEELSKRVSFASWKHHLAIRKSQQVFREILAQIDQELKCTYGASEAEEEFTTPFLVELRDYLDSGTEGAELLKGPFHELLDKHEKVDKSIRWH